MRYSRVQPGAPYSTRVAVFMQEFVKLPICTLFYAIECGGLGEAIHAIRTDLTENSVEWLQLGLPALLYTVQNNALFIGLSNLEAAVAHVTYQTKILFTALCSICLLGKRLGWPQWLGLLMLVIGVICVQGLFDQLLASAQPSADLRRSGRQRSDGRQLAVSAGSSSVGLGVSAMLTASLCTSFASVYFEKMLKGSRKPSLWLRNIQLASYCMAIAAVTVELEEDPLRISEGWLHGFSPAVWGVVGMNVCGGLLVAVTIKYADNIVRGFAQAVAIIFGALGSWFLFDFQISTSFVVGVFFVIGAILLYGGAISVQDCDLCSICSRPRVDVEPDAEVALMQPATGSEGEASTDGETGGGR